MSLTQKLGALALALAAWAGAARAGDQGPPLIPPGWRVQRVVMLYRHGLRAPLADEIGARDYARQPWPQWSTPPSLLTPHGREGVRLMGIYDRELFAAEGLLPASGCPAPGQVAIWTNTEARTVASGEELAEGLAPGCQIPIGHLPLDRRDPLFDSSVSVPDFDGRKAAQAVREETGGPAALLAPEAQAVRTLEVILGCRSPGQVHPCDLVAQPSSVEGSPDGHGIELRGPIAVTSGTAAVFMLQYLEGMPLDRVGWGRATPDRLRQVSRLHALLFDVYDRPTVMARRTLAALAPRMAALLQGEGGAPVTLLVGHDNNIAALASRLGAHFELPGYGRDDPPLGGALGFLVLQAPGASGASVRVFYQAQTPAQLRRLTPLHLQEPPSTHILRVRCGSGPLGLCPLQTLSSTLEKPSS